MLLSKTPAGLRELKARSAALTPRQRTALILFDGKRQLQEVLAAAGPVGVTEADVGRLLDLGLIGGQDDEAASLAAPELPVVQNDARYLKAYRTAVQLTSELGPRSAQLLLAVEAAEGLDELAELAPRLRAVLLPLKFARFEAALHAR